MDVWNREWELEAVAFGNDVVELIAVHDDDFDGSRSLWRLTIDEALLLAVRLGEEAHRARRLPEPVSIA